MTAQSEDYEQPIRDYSALTREQLERRLSKAEDLALMFSWTRAIHETDREKAAHELWRLWLEEAGDGWTRPRNHPHLSDEAIQPLVALRDRTRAETLRRIRGEVTSEDSFA